MAANPIKIKNPNSALWENYDRFAAQRGMQVKNILLDNMYIPGAKILDVGCGNGDIARCLATAGAIVTGIDIKPPVKKISFPGFNFRQLSLESLVASEKSFDAVILADVLEHLHDPHSNLTKIHYLLKSGGWLYLSTPNKFSPLNVLSDPHYSLPGIALLNRGRVKKIITALRWHTKDKTDFPQLLSFKQIITLLQKTEFFWSFVNRQSMLFALEHPYSLWSRPSHLALISRIQKNWLKSVILKTVNDHKGFFNRFFNPTWFILAQRKN
ncbi:methyltransferase domain-containing protein [candidate division KSB1 bacterium]|nr:methyltransferase domain-containing protein [candidate division KSB1 bacterium]